jgi:hypothetical protein
MEHDVVLEPPIENPKDGPHCAGQPPLSSDQVPEIVWVGGHVNDSAALMWVNVYLTRFRMSSAPPDYCQHPLPDFGQLLLT